MDTLHPTVLISFPAQHLNVNVKVTWLRFSPDLKLPPLPHTIALAPAARVGCESDRVWQAPCSLWGHEPWELTLWSCEGTVSPREKVQGKDWALPPQSPLHSHISPHTDTH